MLFLPLKEQGHQSTALPISSPTWKHFRTGLFWIMSAARRSFCAVLQLSHSVPALEVKNYEGYLRWARLAKWHSPPARCQLPRKLPNWHLGHEIRPVMSKRYLITMCNQGSPSGHRNWRLTEEREDTRQLHVSLKLTHLFLFSPIYRALLWEL